MMGKNKRINQNLLGDVALEMFDRDEVGLHHLLCDHYHHRQ